MMMKPKKTQVVHLLLLMAIVAWGLMWGCAPSKPTPTEHSATNETRGLTVVLPFIDMAKIYGSNASVRNPVTAKVFVTGQIDEKAALDLTNELYRLIGNEIRLKWGSLQAPSNTPESSPFGPYGLKADHSKHLRDLGRREGADTVMVGYLYAFRNRTGGDYGVERPSHVSFELVMVQTTTGRIVWQRSFKEIQKPLSEDLLQFKNFIKRKGRWVSALEMAKGALKEMLQTVPQFDSH